MRMYEMFMGPLEASKPWATRGIVGVRRFVERVWRTAERPVTDAEPKREHLKVLHQTIRKVGEDTSRLEFNTAIAQMMIFVNEIYAAETEPLPRGLWEPFVLVLAPYAPHLAEELWERLGRAPSVSGVSWPAHDPELAREQTITVVAQVNGKVRDRMELPAGTPRDELEKRALALDRVRQFTDGKRVVKVIVVPDKLVNVVVKE
jgi:leucyl-tRNA synthetase